MSGSNEEKLETLKTVLATSETGMKGVEESEFILKTVASLGVKSEVELDLTLARGLNYYTGAIFEVKALDVQIGSISGGGRYDNLTGVFGMDGMSGVGISFGADRIFDVLNQLDLYPKEAVNGTELLFVNFGEKETAYCLPVLAKMRDAGVRAEIYPDSAKMKKQMGYANDKQIPFVAIVGENEMKFDATEPNQGEFNYGGSDAILWLSDRYEQVVRGHTLAWHQQVPSWVSSDGKKNNNNFSKRQLLDILKNHIFNVVGRYKGKITEWDVCNEVQPINFVPLSGLLISVKSLLTQLSFGHIRLIPMLSCISTSMGQRW